jgi:hypothetical protein
MKFLPSLLAIAALTSSSPSFGAPPAAKPAAPVPTPVPGPAPLPAPPQNKGLPYTRSASEPALEKIRAGIAVFAGSRYGYVHGFRVRLDAKDLLRAPAVEKNGVVYVPAAFAALVGSKNIAPRPVPADLAAIADRWVYAPEELDPAAAASFQPPSAVATLPVGNATYYSFPDLARAAGLNVTIHPRGLVYAGVAPLTFSDQESPLLDSLITLFDTPDKFADPGIAARSIPALERQGVWTDHIKVTPQQMAVLTGPETVWPTAPKSAYDFKGFNAAVLGSAVPPPGVYPRLLFSEKDIPAIAARVKGSRLGRMSLIEMKALFEKSWWDPKTSDGQVFEKLSSGHLDGLVWEAPPGTPLCNYPQTFKGQVPGIHNSHVAYDPECLTAMALYCLITGDDSRGRQVAAAVANYYKLREPLLDEWLKISDSEFGSSITDASGAIVNLNGAGARTHWRNTHGLVGHMNLALSLDFAGRWMNAEQKDIMRRVIAKATYGRRSYAQDAPVRFRDVNWMGWDLTHFLAVAAIEGLPGFDAEAYASGAESVRAFCDWGIDEHGVVFESNGKTSGSFQFITLSMATLARRGENLFGHPHWRRLLEGQIQMTSPSGRVTVNSGTQYAPYTRSPLSLTLVNEFKGFYPASRLADFLVTKALSASGSAADEFLRAWPREDFDPARYAQEVKTLQRLRLPSVTYPGFVRGVLYDRDTIPTTRADLGLPLDFDDPVQGVFSSYSDATPLAAWMNIYVRPHHYLGAGHHHADAGSFHFSALGVDWFTQSAFSQAFDGTYFSLVQVDGASEPVSVPGQILGYNGVAAYLGARISPLAAVGSADLTYAYSWRWLTQPPQIWSDEVKTMGWELDPTPENLRIWAGTARYKMRPWWANYNYSNYIPTSRAKFNPMEFVFRSTGLVRGPHPYGFVLDDLKKDAATHLYQWTGMLNGGVWKADVPGLAANQIALASTGTDPDLNSNAPKPALKPKPGDPLLLVCALGMKDSGDPAHPLITVETAEGSKDRKGVQQYLDRLRINQTVAVVNYRILLLPVKAGEPLPAVTYDPAKQTARVSWTNQVDTLAFRLGDDQRTHVQIARDGKDLLP